MVKGFLEHIKNKGFEITLGTEFPTKLKPTQNTLSLEKAKDMVQFGIAALPIIISNDNRILDGHHRWLAQTQLLPTAGSRTIPVYRINLNIAELLKLTKEYTEK
jgi:hypothetical protein